MIKLLKKHGWKLDRIKGSHHIFEKDGFEDISVPVHGKKDLKHGIERSNLKKSGLLHFWKNRKGGKK